MSVSLVFQKGYLGYRGWIQGKTRIVLAWLFVGVLGALTREYPHWPGVVLCGIGAFIRFWASGWLKKDHELATQGPYALVRNPLYLGTFLMAVGILWAVQLWVLLAITAGFFLSVYHFVILDEETKLRKLFPQTFDSYCQKTPRVIPSPYSIVRAFRSKGEQFSWSLASKNKAFEAILSFVGLVGFTAVVAFLWQP
jgi:protein-S-isoprenylcysteine O-methyltransferase Ste14